MGRNEANKSLQYSGVVSLERPSAGAKSACHGFDAGRVLNSMLWLPKIVEICHTSHTQLGNRLTGTSLLHSAEKCYSRSLCRKGDKMKKLVVILASLFLAACATTYQPSGFTGGYGDYQVGDQTYMVSFSANGYTSSQTAYQFFLTRAADLTLQNGYKYFYIMSSQDTSSSFVTTTNGSATTTFIGNNAYTTYTPPQVTVHNKPGFQGQIYCVNQPLDNQPVPFNAQLVFTHGMNLKQSVDNHNTTMEWLFGGGTAALLLIGLLSSF